MSRTFKLELTQATCNILTGDQGGGIDLGPLGDFRNKDEMYLFGFGISRKGHLLIFYPKSLGSFSTSKTFDYSPSIEIGSHELNDDDNHVEFCLWPLEVDSGYASNSDNFSRFGQHFVDRYNLKVSELRQHHYPEPVAHQAFNEILMYMHHFAILLGQGVRLDDDIYTPTIIRASHIPGVTPRDGSSGVISSEFILNGEDGNGDYTLKFKYAFSMAVILPS